MTLFDIKPFFDWLQIHPFWAGFIAYLIAFFECLVILGLLIPGTVFMTAIGTLIGIGVLPFTSIALWGIAGAITGDVLSFWIGRHYHEHTAVLWLFRRYPKLLQKGEAFFDRHGGKSIFVGRFMGPIRAVLPCIAGMVHMPYRQFLAADVISAIAWVPIYMLPGILLGQASQQLPPDVAIKLILFVVLLLLFFWLLCSVIKSCYAWFSRLLDKQIAYLWRFTRHHPRLGSLSSFLMDPHAPQSHTQLALALVCFFSCVALLLLAFSVAHHGIAGYFDAPVDYFMRSLRQVTLDKFFVAITELSPRVLFGFWSIILVVLLFKRNFWTALHWGILGLLSFGSVDILKHAMHVPRPSGLVRTPAGASFPSGHTVSSVSLLVFFAILISRDRPKKYLRILIGGLTTVTVVLILFSRIYLTAHWLTDVLAGLLLGVTLVSGITLSFRRKKQRHALPRAQLALIGLGTLLILWGANVLHEYPQQKQNYRLYFPSPDRLSMEDWWVQAAQQKLMYRMNRFGQPLEVLNVQWAEKLSIIQRNLEKHGWHTLPKARLLTTLYHVSLRQHDPVTPLFISANAGEKPALTMAKYFPVTHHLLVLKLWKAQTQLSDGTPLWSGLVRYQNTWHLQFQPLKKLQTICSVPAEKLLQKDLQHYRVKNVSYSSSHPAILFIAPLKQHHK